MNNSESDFTQGSILGKLIPFMMPILGALILQAAYGAVDLLVVGNIVERGENGLQLLVDVHIVPSAAFFFRTDIGGNII